MRRSLTDQRLFFWLNISAVITALLLALVELPRTPLPWGDEMLLVSTAAAIRDGNPGIPSVLNAFPHTGHVDLFEGSVPFWVGAASLKIFGLSLWSWRSICWFFGVALVFASAWTVLLLGAPKTHAALASALVTFSPALGSSLTSGRLDTLTVACEMLAVCLLISKPSLTRSLFAGLLLGAASLSTPRAQPFMVSLFAVALAYAILQRNMLFLRGLVFSGATAALCVCAWTLYVGLNPWSWLRLVLAVSSGDKTNSSPMLGGSWGGFDVRVNSFGLIVPTIIAVWLALFLVRRVHDRQRLGTAGALLIALLVNAGLTVILTSRTLSYEMFWLVPLIPVVVAVTAIYEPDLKLSSSPLFGVLMALLLVTLLVRCGKVGEVFISWRSRDPHPITEFICDNVPRHSTVYGPADFYYYGVEQCGSRYLYPQQWIAVGLVSPLDSPPHMEGTFLIWPAGEPVTVNVKMHESARFRPVGGRARKGSSQSKTGLIDRVLRYTGGYPETVLYKIE